MFEHKFHSFTTGPSGAHLVYFVKTLKSLNDISKVGVEVGRNDLLIHESSLSIDKNESLVTKIKMTIR